MMKIMRSPVSLFALNIVLTLYLFALNLFSNHGMVEIQAAVWPALVLLALGWLLALVHRWPFKLFWTLNLLAGSVAVFAKSQYRILITEDILLSALISENDLTAEMISVKSVCFVLVFGLLPVLLLWRQRIRQVGWRRHLACCGLASLAALLAVFGLFQYKGYHFRGKGSIRDSRFMGDVLRFSPLDVYYNGQRARKSVRDMKRNYAGVERMPQKYRYLDQKDDLLVVFVIGESTRGDRFSLNGYPRNTNPQLAAIPNLYSFKNAQSCDTLTVNSLNCLSSPMLKSSPDRTPRQSSFGEVFRSLGYRSEIYSLQTLSGFYSYMGYDRLVSKYQIVAEQQSGAWDAALLPYMRQSVAQYRVGKMLLVLHTLGSHQTYADRIPPHHRVFTPYCTNPDVSHCSKAELDNAYDNTVLGVDELLAETIKSLSDKRALLIYVSDHGESLGENGDYFHGKPVNIAPKEQFSIPFVVWFSESYRQSPEGKVLAERVAQAVKDGRAVSHDNIFHTVLGCAGITSPDGGIDPHLDICAADAGN